MLIGSGKVMPMVTTLALRARTITWIDAQTAVIDPNGDHHVIRRRSNGGWSCTCPRPAGRLCTHMITAELTAPAASPTANGSA